MSVLQTHTPGGEPGPSWGERELAGPSPARGHGLRLFRGTGLLRGGGPRPGVPMPALPITFGATPPPGRHTTLLKRPKPLSVTKRRRPKPLFWHPPPQPAKTVAGAQRVTGQEPGLTRWLMMSSRQSRLQTTASTGAWGFSTGRQVKARPQSSKGKSRPWGSGDRQRSLGQRAGAESHQALDFDKGFSHIIFSRNF